MPLRRFSVDLRGEIGIQKEFFDLSHRRQKNARPDWGRA
jgi:hypothetical protein